MYKFIIFLLIASFHIYSYEVNPEDYYKTTEEELQEIAILMKDMAERIRQDRHDTTVQIQGKEIDDRIEKLFKIIEVKESRAGDKDSKTIYINSIRNGDNKDKLIKQSDIAPKQENNQIIKYRNPKDDWARLSNKKREEVFQTWGSEMPEKWKKRIEAYFLSLAVLENNTKR